MALGNQIGLALASPSEEPTRVLGVRVALGALVLVTAGGTLARRVAVAWRRRKIGGDAVTLAAAAIAWALGALELVARVNWPAVIAANLPSGPRWPATMGAEIASALLVFALVAYAAELSLARDALRDLKRRVANRNLAVFRVGDRTIDAVRRGTLASGDIVHVREGDLVPTDIRLLTPARFREEDERGELVAKEREPGEIIRADTLLLSDEVTGVVVRPYASELAAAIDAEAYRALARLEARPTTGWGAIAARAMVVVTLVLTLAAAALQILRTSPKSPAVWLAVLAVLAASSPAAFTVAAVAAKRIAILRLHGVGIIVKDPDALRRIASVDVACFDKAGTITTGELSVVGFRWLDGAEDPALLEDALALERSSSHRAGQAIASWLRGRGVAASTADSVWEHSGGITGRVRGRLVEIGAPRRVRSDSTEAPPHVAVAWMAVNGVPVAVFELCDPVRPGAERAARALWDRGVAVRVLSGDRTESTSHLGQRLGVASCGDLSPAKKALVVRDLQHAGARVLYVGDGLTDAAGAAQADAAVAIAPDTLPGVVAAPVVITSRSLGPMALLVDVARALDGRTRENFAIGAVYNAVVLPLCALGMIPPLYAAALMVIETLLVLANASRLLHAGRDARSPRRCQGAPAAATRHVQAARPLPMSVRATGAECDAR